jgi:hypothetical protein
MAGGNRLLSRFLAPGGVSNGMFRALAAVYITPRSEKYRGFSHGFSILVQAVMA